MKDNKNVFVLGGTSCKDKDSRIEELAKKFMEREMERAILDYDPNTIPCTSASPSEFSIEEFEKAMQTLKDMPPIVVEMEVYQSVWHRLKECIPEADTNLLGYVQPSRIDGVRIIPVPENNDFKINQTKLIYNDGSEKIVELFKEEK